jgi:DNA-binding transcriptional LysR family regulator
VEIGQPAVSKQISALEDELGTELIHRASRSIALTEAGRDFYESALHILDDFENATSRIGRGQTAPKGLIRMSTKVRIFIEHLEKTFALCSQFNPRPS